MQNERRETRVVRLISLFYLGMAAVGAALIWWRQDSWGSAPLGFVSRGWPGHFAATFGLVAAVHLLSRVAHSRFASFRAGARDVRRMLGQLAPWQIGIVAAVSGLGEEFLFRGWLMNETGLWISSAIFGLVHVPPNKKWFYWPGFAFAIGILLGWLYAWSGSLLYPILLHAGINFLNLRMMLPPTATRSFHAGVADREW